jgi:ceramide glucosyltransferase
LSEANDPLPPITFLRPLKRDTPRLAATLENLARAMRPDDQLLLGLGPDSYGADVCKDLQKRFPKREIQLVDCIHSKGVNPKIAKLLQMTPNAHHKHWVLSDSEALLDPKLVEAFRREWSANGADALTAGYRFIHLETLPQQLDAASSLLTLWPGLAVLQRFGKLRLTLGACTAFRRGDLEAVGGLAAFSQDLAEDNRLGWALTQAGKAVRLSRHVVTLTSDAMSWRDYWRHQRRVAVTYRVSNPAGFAASIVTHGLSLVVGAAIFIAPTFPVRALILIGAAWFARWCTARAAGRIVDFPIPKLALVVFIASLAETTCWMLAWFSRKVWWAGEWWSISRDGKLSAA